MQPSLPPFRDRTPVQLRQQAEALRQSAAVASGTEAANLISLAERYETMAGLKEGTGGTTPLTAR